jgi:hypothetical protein
MGGYRSSFMRSFRMDASCIHLLTYHTLSPLLTKIWMRRNKQNLGDVMSGRFDTPRKSRTTRTEYERTTNAIQISHFTQHFTLPVSNRVTARWLSILVKNLCASLPNTTSVVHPNLKSRKKIHYPFPNWH